MGGGEVGSPRRPDPGFAPGARGLGHSLGLAPTDGHRLGACFLTCEMAVARNNIRYDSRLACKMDTEGRGRKEGARWGTGQGARPLRNPMLWGELCWT